MDTNTLSRANAPLKFIRDVASETDFFGSHEKVAHAIGNVLRANDDIKVIGLLGPLIAEPVRTWETGILTGSSTLSLALELASLEPDWREVSKVYTALDSTLAMLIDDADDAKTERWFRATQLISIDARRTLFKNLRDRINSGASIANLALLIKSGSRDLLLDGGFAEESDESVRHVVLPLVASNEGLTVLASIEDMTAEWIARAEPSSRTFLVERLDALESAADDEDRQRFGQLRRAWSLDPLIVMGSGDSKDEST